MNGLGAIDFRMLSFVRDTIVHSDANATELDTRFPFRNRFHHCVRVALIAVEIAEQEGADMDVAAISGIFHDSGKAAGRDHAEVSAEICRKYLTENRLFLSKIDRIVDCVRHHSAHIPFERCAYPHDLAVLRDADRLDEVGAMGITWTLLGVGSVGLKSYYDALNRLVSVHLSEDEAAWSDQMYTATGKALIVQRVRREQRFIEELAEELGINRIHPDVWAV